MAAGRSPDCGASVGVPLKAVEHLHGVALKRSYIGGRLAVFLIFVGLSSPQFAKAVLYTRDATIFGSTAQLFSGSEGVRAYFSKLPPGIKAKMGNQQAIAVGLNILLSFGFANFTLKDDTVIPHRLKLALAKVDNQWLIAQHHGSPVPK